MRSPILFASMLLAGAAPALAQEADGQPFRLFFDWGKPELTRDAQAILDQVAAAYQQRHPSRVIVAGHTDRSGSSSYNLAASKRRAEAVKDYLAAHGIPGGVINASGYGESQPIVPTEDNVREVQNRRVEVSFVGGASAARTIAPLVGSDGSQVGTATLTGNSLTIDARGLQPGDHGFHLHAVGKCEGPDFASAGPHWNPTNRKHGTENAEGHHAGDLPNLTVGADGRGAATLELPDGFVDTDGAAVVIHAGADDNKTDPSGNSGARIACAAFTR
jgi:Cu-Zn family superoxide dismutase